MARLLEAAEPGLEVEIIAIRTSGDEGAPKSALPGGPEPGAPGDKSRFTKEIEEALLNRRVDIGVHSAKDVPGALPEGLAIVGVPERIDARDALCGPSSLDALPEGALVGTSSLRRKSQLAARRPDLRLEDLRGNVDTRLRRLADGDYDAMILAVAGLRRLERSDGVALPASEMTPAAGQGCLALEGRAGDERTSALAGRLTHRPSLTQLTAERALVTSLDASCRTPVGAHAELDGGELRLSAYAGLPDGSVWVRDSAMGDAEDPTGLGGAVAGRMLAAGAREILDAAEREDAP